jgi:hypothetical protein
MIWGVEPFLCAECAQEVFQRLLGIVKKNITSGARRLSSWFGRGGNALSKFIKRLQSVCLAELLCYWFRAAQAACIRWPPGEG